MILAALVIALQPARASTYITDLLGRVVLFVPKVMVALLILAFGTYFARFVGNAVIAYCRNVAHAGRATSSAGSRSTRSSRSWC